MNPYSMIKSKSENIIWCYLGNATVKVHHILGEKHSGGVVFRFCFSCRITMHHVPVIMLDIFQTGVTSKR